MQLCTTCDDDNSRVETNGDDNVYLISSDDDKVTLVLTMGNHHW